MNEPCNLAPDRQPGFVAAPCSASYRQAMTTIESDCHDIGTAGDYIRRRRDVERVSMVAWSLSGPHGVGAPGPFEWSSSTAPAGIAVARLSSMLKLIGSYILAKLLGFGILAAIVIYLLLTVLT